ncbi:hypothetical protein [Ensifer sp. B1-9]|uniref:hypothetical protein n=1 Tax=Ensifer sp. B1-9 TaxID=3141455 RepID=UPI003D1DAEDD
MIVKPRLDHPEKNTHATAPGFARMFEKFGFVFEPVDTPRSGAADGRAEKRP